MKLFVDRDRDRHTVKCTVETQTHAHIYRCTSSTPYSARKTIKERDLYTKDSNTQNNIKTRNTQNRKQLFKTK